LRSSNSPLLVAISRVSCPANFATALPVTKGGDNCSELAGVQLKCRGGLGWGDQFLVPFSGKDFEDLAVSDPVAFRPDDFGRIIAVEVFLLGGGFIFRLDREIAVLAGVAGEADNEIWHFGFSCGDCS
jgi:hypothetical protein